MVAAVEYEAKGRVKGVLRWRSGLLSPRRTNPGLGFILKFMSGRRIQLCKNKSLEDAMEVEEATLLRETETFGPCLSHQSSASGVDTNALAK